MWAINSWTRLFPFPQSFKASFFCCFVLLWNARYWHSYNMGIPSFSILGDIFMKRKMSNLLRISSFLILSNLEHSLMALKNVISAACMLFHSFFSNVLFSLYYKNIGIALTVKLQNFVSSCWKKYNAQYYNNIRKVTDINNLVCKLGF